MNCEKIETILSRGVFSTRPRDFYDVYAIVATIPYDEQILNTAIQATAKHRGSWNKIKATKKAFILYFCEHPKYSK